MRLLAFTVAPGVTGLDPLGSPGALGANSACYVALSPDRRQVAVATYGQDRTTVFGLDASGKIQPDPQVLRGTGTAADGHAHWVQWSPEGDRLYAVDLGRDPPAVRRIPLRLVLNEDALTAYAESVGATVAPGRNVGMAGLGTRVHDLLALEGGRRLAASYTYWDPERNCARFRVATIALSQDWSAPPAANDRGA